jgi:outer membrane protein assembly factor BamB
MKDGGTRMSSAHKIDPNLDVLVVGSVEKTIEPGVKPKTRILGYHDGKRMFEIEDTCTFGGDVVFMDAKHLIFSDFYSGIHICDAETLETLLWERHPADGNFGKISANERYIFSTIGQGSEGNEDTVVMDADTLKAVRHLAGGYDACLNGNYFIVIPQGCVCVYDSTTLEKIGSAKTGKSSTFNYNVTSSGNRVAVNNGKGEIVFFKLPGLEMIGMISDEGFKRRATTHNFSIYPLISNRQVIGISMHQGSFDFHDTQTLRKVGTLDFKPMLTQNIFCLSEGCLFAYQAEQIKEAEDPGDYDRTIGRYFHQSIGVYDIRSMKEIGRIEIPQEIHVKSLYFRERAV